MLPIRGPCACCGSETNVEVVDAIIDCERRSIRYRESVSVIWIPGFFTMWTVQPEKPEVFGNDTSVPAPICMCKACQTQVRRTRIGPFVGPPILALVLGALAALLHIAVGIVVTVLMLLLGYFLSRWWVVRTRQRELKNVLGGVPVYRQMLAAYPYGVVILPEQSPTT